MEAGRRLGPNTYSQMYCRSSGGRRSRGEAWLFRVLRAISGLALTFTGNAHSHCLLAAFGSHVEYTVAKPVEAARRPLDDSMSFGLDGRRCDLCGTPFDLDGRLRSRGFVLGGCHRFVLLALMMCSCVDVECRSQKARPALYKRRCAAKVRKLSGKSRKLGRLRRSKSWRRSLSGPGKRECDSPSWPFAPVIDSVMSDERNG